MKLKTVLQVLLCVVSQNIANALTSEEVTEVRESCCTSGEAFATTASAVQRCSDAAPPEDVESEQLDTCRAELMRCCEQQFRHKDECSAGMKMAPEKRCSVPKSDVGKTCCEECSFGRWTGESQGREACGEPAGGDVSPSTALRKNAYYQCCLEAADKPETTTERKETTTEKRVTTTRKPSESCKSNPCDHLCNDDDGRVTCQCHDGFRLQADKKSCKDINECAEADDDLCTADGTVCHNTAGAFKCVPVRKRDVGLTCPPGFKRNVHNQVCDDINECQLPRPPCPKYLCENTIGGYKCGGKPGKPFEEAVPGATTEASVSSTTAARNDICPPGFRAGPDDECLDIDECNERLDDCQRLSQHCINTHGSFFCQDHVSKRCAPGFKVNDATGVCEDIDECEESTEVCKRNEVCVNMPGAYTCKFKSSTLPKIATKTCQEGTRLRSGTNICEDIDECREGTHLCDQFQNCINTYGGHECRCKNGYELDSSGSCVDIDECALKLDNCGPGTHCINSLGTFSCSRRAPTTPPIPPPPVYDYEYYDSEEDNSTINETNPEPVPYRPHTTSTVRPRTPPKPHTPTSRPSTPTSRPPTSRPPSPAPRPPSPPPRPVPVSRPISTTPSPTLTPTSPITTSSTTPSPPPLPPRPPYEPQPRTTSTRRPYTSRPRPTRPTPSPTTSTKRPEVSVTPKRPPTRRPDPEPPVEVTLPTPKNPVTIERDPSEGIDTSEIPKDRWTNVIGKERTEKPENKFDPNLLHCLTGFERNELGECVDTDECKGVHICSNLEVCVNQPGGYKCDCIAGFRRDEGGWCVVDTTSTTSTTTIRPTTTEPPTTAVSTPDWPHTPRSRPRQNPPTNCELGYRFDSAQGNCVDIDECGSNKANCSPQEDCVNLAGGYRCECGRRCRQPSDPINPTYVVPPRHVDRNTNVITVGAQYGQKGARSVRPTFTRQHTGELVTRCPWGYKLTSDNMCLDIDECAKNISECGPQQRCENFYGGYSCQCPAGHKLVGQDGWEDIDECVYGQPCPYNAQCINTVGSYRCACGDGFRNAPSNEKVCVDIDECTETPHVCADGCANVWGGYRCYCQRGYRLSSDNRTCTDVDECAEWAAAAVRARGRLCGGACVNVPGSYRCSCPAGYRLSEDARSCIDIDECDSGEATCARADPGNVCQNTRGSYHCHRINCPNGYKLEAKHRCARVQRSCPMSDWSCIHQPSSYSYNFITFVANIYLPEGSVDLFTMHGPAWRDSMVNFDLRMIDVQASPGVQPADISCFDMRPMNNMCRIALLCSLGGPQVAEMELSMSLYQRGQFAGSAVARLVVIVSQYEF